MPDSARTLNSPTKLTLTECLATDQYLNVFLASHVFFPVIEERLPQFGYKEKPVPGRRFGFASHRLVRAILIGVE